MGRPGANKGKSATLLQDFLKKYRLDQTTGIDLSGEAAGRIPTPEWKAEYFRDTPEDAQWKGGDYTNMCIGQGYVLVTPLEIAVGYGAIASGNIVKPHLLKEVRNAAGDVALTYQSQVVDTPDVSMSEPGPSSATRCAASPPTPKASRSFSTSRVSTPKPWPAKRARQNIRIWKIRRGSPATRPTTTRSTWRRAWLSMAVAVRRLPAPLPRRSWPPRLRPIPHRVMWEPSKVRRAVRWKAPAKARQADVRTNGKGEHHAAIASNQFAASSGSIHVALGGSFAPLSVAEPSRSSLSSCCWWATA